MYAAFCFLPRENLPEVCVWRKTERTFNNMNEAENSKHDKHADKAPHHVLLPCLALFGIVSILNKLKHAVQKINECIAAERPLMTSRTKDPASGDTLGFVFVDR
jgi:hypothetical protein